MASKELIEKVAKSIYESWENVPDASNRDWNAYVEKLPGGADCFRKHAEAAISTILDALQEPTGAMKYAAALYTNGSHDLARAAINAAIYASPLGEQSE